MNRLVKNLNVMKVVQDPKKNGKTFVLHEYPKQRCFEEERAELLRRQSKSLISLQRVSRQTLFAFINWHPIFRAIEESMK